MGKRELIALLNLSSWCLVMVERLFLAVPRGCLQFVIVVFPDHTHLLFNVQLYIIIVGCSREGGHCLPVGHRVQEGCNVLECQLKGNCLAVEKVSTGFTIIFTIYFTFIFTILFTTII